MSFLRRSPPLTLLYLLFLSTISSRISPLPAASDSHHLVADGTVLELDDSTLDSAISRFDFILVDFYAPWCGHCKRLSPELDEAAPVLARLKVPIVIAKINADKYTKLASKYEIDGYPTLKFFMHGVPIEYSGPRKAKLLVQSLEKYIAPDVSILQNDSSVSEFVKTAGTEFPIFIGFGMDVSKISELAKKYKKKAWFSVVKDFSKDLMVTYGFDEVPALVASHPKYGEQNVFYGPFEGDFLEEFIKQNQLPLAVPISYETLRLLNEDKRKIVLTIFRDDSDETASKLIKILKATASANRDLVFGYVGTKQWEDFTRTFGIKDDIGLPKVVVWDGDGEYFISEDLGTLGSDNPGTQLSWLLLAYRGGKLIRKGMNGPTFFDFISQTSNTARFAIVFLLAVILLLFYQEVRASSATGSGSSVTDPDGSSAESENEEYHPSDKED